jgi:PAP2 superfamily
MRLSVYNADVGRPAQPPLSLRDILTMAYPHRAIWFAGAALFVVNCLWLAVSAHVSIGLAWLMTTPALMLAGVLVAFCRKAAPYRFPPHMVRPSRYLMVVLATGILLQNLSVFNSLSATLPVPLADARLQAWDRALGLDWLAYAKLTLASPALATLLLHAYRELAWIMPAAMLAVWVHHDNDRRVLDMACLASATAVMGALAEIAFPALTPLRTLADAEFNTLLQTAVGDPSSLPGMTGQLAQLRGGGPVELVPAGLRDLTFFPSFHASMAVITAWCCRGTRWTAIAGAVCAVLIVAATPVMGGRYLSDVLAGIGLAAGAIFCWERWIKARAQKFRAR